MHGDSLLMLTTKVVSNKKPPLLSDSESGGSTSLGPCWATIYAETLKSVEEKYTETAGAILVMAIIGAACVPAIQGLVSDMLGSMQLSFIVNFFCFAYVGGYFYKKMKSE